MKVLAVDTSSSLGGLALVSGDSSQWKVLAAKNWFRQKSHSEIVTSSLQECLEAAHMQLADLDAIAVGTGPGSFTGIRVGLNLGRTLGYAQGTQCCAIPSLRVLAQPALGFGKPVLAMMNAFKNMIYIAAYERQGDHVIETLAPTAVKATELEKWVSMDHFCVGDAYPVYHRLFSSELKSRLLRVQGLIDYPQAIFLGQIAVQESSPDALISWKNVKPLYIRASEAEEKLQGGLLKPLPKL